MKGQVGGILALLGTVRNEAADHFEKAVAGHIRIEQRHMMFVADIAGVDMHLGQALHSTTLQTRSRS